MKQKLSLLLLLAFLLVGLLPGPAKVYAADAVSQDSAADTIPVTEEAPSPASSVIQTNQQADTGGHLWAYILAAVVSFLGLVVSLWVFSDDCRRQKRTARRRRQRGRQKGRFER